MYHNKFLVLGGDMRNISLSSHLQEDNNKVMVYGFSSLSPEEFPHLMFSKNMQKAIKNAEVVIGPIPCCSEKNILNTPFHKQSISIDSIFEAMDSRQIFVAGRIDKEVFEKAKEKKIIIYDVLERNEMAILNAIPTAEGAIQIAFEQTKITLHGANILVIGFGRIGKILSKMLKGIGANVFGATRRYDDYASMVSYGYNPLMLSELNGYLSKMDVIINTAPHVLIDKSNIKFIKKDCLIIDLASAPYGVDFEECKREGINAVLAGSLPGKVAPISAAKYIKETVYNILCERIEKYGFEK